MIVNQGRRHGFRLGWANLSGENSARNAENCFQFAHPGFNNMAGQRSSCDYLKIKVLEVIIITSPLALSFCVPPVYQFACIIISNHNDLAVTAVHKCQELDKCFNNTN